MAVQRGGWNCDRARDWSAVQAGKKQSGVRAPGHGRLRRAWVATVLATAPGLVLAWGQEPMFEHLCEQQLPPANIEVRTDLGRLEVNTNRSIRELSAMRSGLDGTAVLGLVTMRTRQMVRMVWGAAFSDPSTARVCMRPNLVVELGVLSHVLHVGREVPKNSCAYNDVYRHEMRHVSVNVEYIKRVAQLVRERLLESIGTQVLVGLPHEVQERLERDVSAVYLPKVSQLMRGAEHEHTHIDSPEELARGAIACNGQLADLAARYGIDGTPSVLYASQRAPTVPTWDDKPARTVQVSYRPSRKTSSQIVWRRPAGSSYRKL